MNREKHRASGQIQGNVSRVFAQRAEGLLRSLTGVTEVRVEVSGVRVSAIYVVPTSESATRGLVRNVQSAMMAALGILVEPRAVLIVPVLPAVAFAPAALVIEAPAKPAPLAAKQWLPDPVPVSASVLRGYRPSPRLEVLELPRLNHDQMQCRVVVEVDGRRRTGSAHAGEEREGAVTLAARATLDAMKHIEEGDWLFEGAADVIIAGQRHIVVSVRKNEKSAVLSGAAPVHESVEHAVAVAVLNAAGLSGALQQESVHRIALES
jgi:hypothetical protein